MHRTPATLEKERQRLSRWFLFLGVLLSLAVIASAALYLNGKRASLITDGIKDARRVNTLLLEQTDRIYDSVDILLRATAAELADGTFFASQDEKALHDMLNSYIAGMPHIKALSILDANGRSLATTFRYPTSHPDFSKRTYFQVLKENPNQGMYIDAPVRRKSNEQQWLLNVALPLPSPKSDFAGVIVVSLVPEYFSSFYNTLQLLEGSYISLLREDSVLLMRHPAKDEVIGKTFGRNPALQPFLKQRLEQVSLSIYSYISKQNVLLTCRFAKLHPIYLCTSTLKGSLLTQWNRDAISMGSVASLVSMVIMGLFIVMYKQMYRREEIAIELLRKNQQLDLMSKTDLLTGIANRRSIEIKINELMTKAQRYNRPFSVVLVDIDNFKKVNDTYGHSVGDQVLQQFSHILSTQTRVTDLAGRWGGEEFMVVCDEGKVNDATQLAEKLRNIIENYEFGLQAPVTSSFGVTQYMPAEKAEALFKRVDDLLYAAKRRGRNAVVNR